MTKMNWDRASARDRVARYGSESSRDLPPPASLRTKGGGRRGTSQHGNPASVVGYNLSPQCVAIKANGQRCGGKAQHGHDLCGPHITHPPKARA